MPHVSMLSDNWAEPEFGEDPVAGRLVTFLRSEGADQRAHGGRNLLAHLLGTYEIVRRWEQPAWLAHAALIHSVYGTEAYRQRLLDPPRRRELGALAGERAEGLAYLFAVTPRRLLFAGTHRWAPGLAAGSAHGGGAVPASPDELDALVLLHLANLAEQARAPDGSPAPWLAALRDRAEVLFHSDAVRLPAFIAELAGLTPAAESTARSAYREGLMQSDQAARAERMALAAANCVVVAEPCVWLAYEMWRQRELDAAREWARTARGRLLRLGTPWDKRLGFEQWLAVLDCLGDRVGVADPVAARDPAELYAEVVQEQRAPAPAGADPAAGLRRFQRYMTELSDAPAPGGRLLYPDLDERPWWEPAASALAVELQAHGQEIRDEVLALDPSRFAPESERIARSGDWDVAFFYERGRRHAEVCRACPTTTRVIESDGAMRTAAGLIYVSRMRPGTHIHPHRGPTNLRLRCHLGISVPEGDCAIRVADESRRWSEGGCLLFDDSFEHEAWNHTDADRIVLIVDLWHPSLTGAEVHLLAGLHRYATGYARGLERYWAVNAAARDE
ncbi:MAG TPA: aspartyl/asparaginyl beta-hydroxylase domain-containing protein, partial [Solirubrobacteraceae bacterium]|nr:aspartyl/asparaginyl beta-hydroxylase domain-containing protein [Solirubrobacteraceae bacterium]